MYSYDYAAIHQHEKVYDFLLSTKLSFPGHPDLDSRLSPFTNIEIEEKILLAIYADNYQELGNYLLDYVKNINGYVSTTKYYGMTLLSVCCAELSDQCLSFLLSLGADINKEHWIAIGCPLKTAIM